MREALPRRLLPPSLTGNPSSTRHDTGHAPSRPTRTDAPSRLLAASLPTSTPLSQPPFPSSLAPRSVHFCSSRSHPFSIFLRPLRPSGYPISLRPSLFRMSKGGTWNSASAGGGGGGARAAIGRWCGWGARTSSQRAISLAMPARRNRPSVRATLRACRRESVQTLALGM